MHREEEEEEEDEATAAVPEAPEQERDGGGGGGGGGQPPSDSAGGSIATSIFTNKKLVLGLVALAGLFILYRYWQMNNGGGGISTTSAAPSPDVTEKPVEPEPRRPNIKKDPSDPLQADHEAFQWVFGDEKQSDVGPIR